MFFLPQKSRNRDMLLINRVNILTTTIIQIFKCNTIIKQTDPKIKPKFILLMSTYRIELSYKVTVNLMTYQKEVFIYQKIENISDCVNCRICF